MDLVVVDFETFYSKEYSLSKLTTEEYIRDPRFQVIGVSTKVNDEPAQWFSGTAKETLAYLRGLVDWSNAGVLSHNTMFDGAILSWRCGIRPKALFDTLCMSRAIYGTEVSHSLKALAKRLGLPDKGDEVTRAIGKRRLDFTPEELKRYGEYCLLDVDLCHQAFNILMHGFPKKELRLIDLTLRMFTEPELELDRPALERHLQTTQQAKEDLLVAAGVDRKTLMSGPKFADLLRQYGVEPPMKISPTTGKPTYAFAKTDEEFKALAEHEDGRIQTFVAARLGNKSTLEETRTQRFIDISSRGKLPVPLQYYAAHTGRFGGCLVADTMVTVFDQVRGVCDKRIVDVMPDDLVWDGVEFVEHEGVVFSGFAEVISWDGVTGTEDHVVFTDAGEISLRDAHAGGHHIQAGGSPDEDAVAAARQRAGKHKAED